jgi:hypothetical protein
MIGCGLIMETDTIGASLVAHGIASNLVPFFFTSTSHGAFLMQFNIEP